MRAFCQVRGPPTPCQRARARANVLAVTSPFPLLAAFDAAPGRVLSLAGGGGKTSLMWALARALVGAGRRVLTTTTTRIYPPARGESPALVLREETPAWIEAIRRHAAEVGHVTVAERRSPDGKLGGLPGEAVDELAASALVDVIIVEADGSAGRPLKAARENEPAFPRSSTDCVLVTGVEALGAPLDERWVFRAALAAEVCGLPPGAPVTAEAVGELLLGPRGLARPAPAAARVLVFVNKVEDPEQQTRAYDLARRLRARGDRRLARVVVGSLRRADAGFAVFEK